MTYVSDRTSLPGENNLTANNDRTSDTVAADRQPHRADNISLALTLDAQRHVMATSPSSFQVLGVAPSALLGECIERLVHPDDQPALLALLTNPDDVTYGSHDLSPDSSQERVRYRVRVHGRKWRAFAISVETLVDGSAHPITLVTLHPLTPPAPTTLHYDVAQLAQRDAVERAGRQLAALVIERDRLLRECEEARANALTAQETTRRMHAFLGAAGHELRSPITSIKAGVQLSERALDTLLGMTLPAETAGPLQRAQALLVRAEQQTDRLHRLIEDILDVTRIQTGKLSLYTEVSDLGAVVRDAVEALQMAWPDREITLDLPDPRVQLILDADRIAQVVANFLTNALKYSAEDQSVSVHVTATPQGGRVEVGDHGPGLSPEMQQHLWELFHQVDSIRQLSGSGVGLGLGLHICRTIVERHGGRVGVESAVGAGSTFWFELPLEPSKSDQIGPTATR